VPSVQLKLHYTDFPVTSWRGNETGRSLTCGRLLTDLLADFIFPRGSYGEVAADFGPS